MKWRDIPKIDAHIHIIPDEVHAANPDSDDEFSFAKVSSYGSGFSASVISKRTSSRSATGRS